MAGRPRTMAKKVAALEARAFALGEELWRLMPQLHKDRPLPSDPMCAAWTEVITNIAETYRAVGQLRGLLDAKINGMPVPPPCPFVEPVAVKLPPDTAENVR